MKVNIVSPEMYDENYQILMEGEFEEISILINRNLMKGKTITELKNSIKFPIGEDLRRVYKEAGWSDVKIKYRTIQIIK